MSVSLQALRDVPDDIIIREVNEEYRLLQKDLEDLKAINSSFAGLVHSQGEEIKEVEKKTEHTVKEVVQAQKQLQISETLQNGIRKITIYMSAGGATGTAIGAVGFVVNPLVGLTAMVVLGLAGAGVGGLASKVT